MVLLKDQEEWVKIMLFWCIILYNQQLPPYKNGLIQKFEGRELKIYTRESMWKNISLSWDLRWELKLFTSKLDVKTINIILLLLTNNKLSTR